MKTVNLPVRLFPVIVTLALTGCAQMLPKFIPYAPPSSGPVANLRVSIHTIQGGGSLFLDPSPTVLMADALGTHYELLSTKKGEEKQGIFQISAGQLLAFEYNGGVENTNLQCHLVWHLTPVANDTYALVMGDTPPTQLSGDFFARLGEVLAHGYSRGKCFARIFKVEPDGHLQPIPIFGGYL